MKLHIVPAGHLSNDHVNAWSRLQQTEPGLASPFFRPEFTQAVAVVRGGVEVAVWERAGEAIGFLPFQRTGRGIGKPVGSPANDFQGAIARPDVAWSPREVIRGAGLRAWEFDHVPVAQTAFAPYQYVYGRSPYIDLSQGYGHFLESRSRNFKKQLRRAERKASAIGEIRLELDSADRHALTKLVEWKAEKCRRTHVPCPFAATWTVNVIEYILAHPSEHFSGLLVSLYIGDQLVSVEFAIRSAAVLHEWHSAYNVELAKCSPGIVMEDRLDQRANSFGITRIDFGKGEEQYKKRFATGFELLAEGAVHVRPLHGPVYRTWYGAKNRLRLSALGRPLRRARRWMFATRNWLTNGQDRVETPKGAGTGHVFPNRGIVDREGSDSMVVGQSDRP